MSEMADRRRFVERMGSALADAGMPRMPARVFAALLVDDDGRMTSAELGEELSVSAGGISGAVRYLERVGMVRRERDPGSRRDMYVVDDDAWHEAMMRDDQTYSPLLAALGSTIDQLGADSPAHRRLVLTREFLSFVRDEMQGLSSRWEERRRTLERELDAR